MGLHAYAIVPVVVPLPVSLQGVDGAVVQAVRCGAVAAWVSRHDAAPAPSIAGVQQHNAVVQAAMDNGDTPVPVRFGQWFADEASLIAQAGADEEHWLALLASFSGSAEYGIRVLFRNGEQEMHAPGGDQAATRGAQYMARLAQQHAAHAATRQRADEAIAFVEAAVAAVVRDRRVTGRGDVEKGGSGMSYVALACMVAGESVARYHSATAQFAAARPEWEFHLTGPWPPYSFVQ